MSSARPSSRARRVVSLAQNKRDTTWRSAAYVRDATHAKSALDYEPWVMVPPPAGASGILLPRPRTPHETRVLAARRAVEAAAVELRAARLAAEESEAARQAHPVHTPGPRPHPSRSSLIPTPTPTLYGPRRNPER